MMIASVHGRDGWGSFRNRCDPYSVYAIEGPLLVALAYPVVLLAALQYYPNERYPWLKAINTASLQGLTAMAVVYGWRIFAPKLWKKKVFFRWLTVLTIIRVALGVLTEVAVESWGTRITFFVVMADTASIVLGFYVIPSIQYIARNGLWPGCEDGDVWTWLVLFQFVFTMSSAVTASLFRDLFEMMVFINITYLLVLTLLIVYVSDSLKPSPDSPRSEVSYLKPFYYPATALAVYCCSFGILGIIHTVRYVRNTLGPNYSPAIGFLMFYFWVVLGISIIEMFIDIIPAENKEELFLPIITFQFFQEFAVGIMFLEAGLTIQFILFIIFVVAYNLLIETGLAYEKFYKVFLDNGSLEHQAEFMARKFILIKQKRFADTYATPAILIVVLMEYLFGERIGITLISAHERSHHEYEEKSTMTAYALLIVIETVTQHISSYYFEKRISSFKTLISKKVENETSVLTQTTIKDNRDLSPRGLDEIYNAAMGYGRTSRVKQTGGNSDISSQNEPPMMADIVGVKKSAKPGAGHLESDALLDRKHDDKVGENDGDKGLEEGEGESGGEKKGGGEPKKGGGETKRDGEQGTPAGEVPPNSPNTLLFKFPVLNPSMQLSTKAYLERNQSNRPVFIIGCLMAMLVSTRWFEPEQYYERQL